MLKSLASSTAYSISTSVLSYTLILLLSRAFSVETFSQYLYLVAWGLLIHQLIDFVSEQCLVHFSKSTSRPIESVWWSLTILKLLILVTIIIVSLFSRHQFKISIPHGALLLIVPAFYMGTLYEYHQRISEYSRLFFLEKLSLLFIAALVFIFKLDIYLFICLSMLVSLASLFVQLRTFKILWSESQYLIKDIKQYVIAYFPVYIIITSQLMYGNISRLIVENKLGAIAFASMTLALQVTNAVSMIQVQVDRHIRPEIFEAIKTSNSVEIRKIVKQYITKYLLVILLGSILLTIFGQKLILFLFGERWSDAGIALRYASPLVLLTACMRFIDIMSIALNASRVNLIVNLSSSVSALSLLWVSPLHSIQGCIMLIILCQVVHVIFMATFLLIKAKNLIALRPSI
jgi:O-antigen/teichoic acid export membrane protein